jgi:hypothetical protein
MPEWNRPLERAKHRKEYNAKMDLKEIIHRIVDWIHITLIWISGRNNSALWSWLIISNMDFLCRMWSLNQALWVGTLTSVADMLGHCGNTCFGSTWDSCRTTAQM